MFQYGFAILHTKFRRIILEIKLKKSSSKNNVQFSLQTPPPKRKEIEVGRMRDGTVDFYSVMHQRFVIKYFKPQVSVTTEIRNPDIVHLGPLVVVFWCRVESYVRHIWRSFFRGPGNAHPRNRHLPLYISFGVSHGLWCGRCLRVVYTRDHLATLKEFLHTKMDPSIGFRFARGGM